MLKKNRILILHGEFFLTFIKNTRINGEETRIKFEKKGTTHSVCFQKRFIHNYCPLEKEACTKWFGKTRWNCHVGAEGSEEMGWETGLKNGWHKDVSLLEAHIGSLMRTVTQIVLPLSTCSALSFLSSKRLMSYSALLQGLLCPLLVGRHPWLPPSLSMLRLGLVPKLTLQSNTGSGDSKARNTSGYFPKPHQLCIYNCDE